MRSISSIVVLCLTMIGCATSEQPRHQSTEYRPYLPPHELDLTINDRKPSNRPIVIVDEEQQYRSSIRKINEVFETEELNYSVCLLVKPRQECDNYLREVCKIDLFLDSRGGHHIKTYCRK